MIARNDRMFKMLICINYIIEGAKSQPYLVAVFSSRLTGFPVYRSTSYKCKHKTLNTIAREILFFQLQQLSNNYIFDIYLKNPSFRIKNIEIFFSF